MKKHKSIILLIILFALSLITVSCGESSKHDTEPESNGSNILVDPLLLGYWDVYSINLNDVNEKVSGVKHITSMLNKLKILREDVNYYPELIPSIKMHIQSDTINTFIKAQGNVVPVELSTDNTRTLNCSEGQIWYETTDGVKTYLYDYYAQKSENIVKMLWIVAETTENATLEGIPPITEELLVFYKQGYSPRAILSTPENAEDVNIKDPIEFTWRAYENAQNYTFQLSSNENFNAQSDSMLMNVTLTETEVVYNNNLQMISGQSYFWRVKANNSDWSLINFFIAKKSLILVSPTINASVTRKPTFVWKKYFNGSEYATSYTIKVAEDDEFTEGVVEDTVDDTIYVCSEGIAGNCFEADVTYRWKVKANNSDWSAPWRVKITKRVTQVSPENEELQLDANDLTLQWTSLSNALNYQLEVSESSDFTNLVINESSITPTDNPNIEYSTNSLDPDKKYYWRVNSDVAADWSDTLSFFTNTKVQLKYPENDANNVGSIVNFQWYPFTRVNYHFQLSTDNTFSTTIVDSIITATQFLKSGLEYNTQYYWRVETDGSGWSTVWNFETAGAVTLVYPDDNAGVGQLPYDNAGVGQLPYFEWMEFSDADSYTLQVADNIGFSPTVLNETVANANDIIEFKKEQELQAGTTYYWRVKSDNTGNWSIVRTFSTLLDEDVVELSAPANNSNNNELLPTFEWIESQEDAERNWYWIRVLDENGTIVFSKTTEDDNAVVVNASMLNFDSSYSWKVVSNLRSSSVVKTFNTSNGLPISFAAESFAYFRNELVWDEPTVTVTGYRIERKSESDVDFQPLATITSNTTVAYTDFNLNSNATYEYRILAYRGTKNTGFVNASSTVVGYSAPDMVNVLVTGGSFQMGSSASEDEQPIHSVTITNDLSVGKYEITASLFADVFNWALGKNKINVAITAGSGTYGTGQYSVSLAGNCKLFSIAEEESQMYFNTGTKEFLVYEDLAENLPLIDVTWYGAVLFANFYSEIKGYEPVYTVPSLDNSDLTVIDYDANGYRLPTEAEWEYIARSSAGNVYPWGNTEPTASQANYGNIVGSEAVVGSYPSGNNQQGICDLAGNVWEWCNDKYGNYSASAQTDPIGATTGSYRIIKGGSWAQEMTDIRSANRGYTKPDLSGNTRVVEAVGFRLVRAQ